MGVNDTFTNKAIYTQAIEKRHLSMPVKHEYMYCITLFLVFVFNALFLQNLLSALNPRPFEIVISNKFLRKCVISDSNLLSKQLV